MSHSLTLVLIVSGRVTHTTTSLCEISARLISFKLKWAEAFSLSLSFTVCLEQSSEIASNCPLSVIVLWVTGQRARVHSHPRSPPPSLVPGRPMLPNRASLIVLINVCPTLSLYEFEHNIGTREKESKKSVTLYWKLA